jgi:transposase-like protein
MSVERRRRWSREEERLVAATLESGASVSEIAHSAGVHVSQLFRRRKERCQNLRAVRPATDGARRLKELLTMILREKWCPEADLNHRHADFQSAALPTELSGHPALTAAVSFGKPLGRVVRPGSERGYNILFGRVQHQMTLFRRNLAGCGKMEKVEGIQRDRRRPRIPGGPLRNNRCSGGAKNYRSSPSSAFDSSSATGIA